MQKFSSTVQCPATLTATGAAGSTPVQGNTPVSPPAATQGKSGSSTPGLLGSSILQTAGIIGGILLVLSLALAVGWYVFRRALLPQTNVKLPPSGARPWSRTHVPNPDSLGGIVGSKRITVLTNANTSAMFGAPTQNNRFVPQKNEYVQGYGSLNNSPGVPSGELHLGDPYRAEMLRQQNQDAQALPPTRSPQLEQRDGPSNQDWIN